MFNPLQSIFGKPKGGRGKGVAGGKGPASGKQSGSGKPPAGGTKNKSGAPRKHHTTPPGEKSAKGGRGAAGSQPPPAPGLSFDRKLDILGIVLVFVGFISLISLFTPNQSEPLQRWVALLGQIAGWGKYALPLGLIVLGGWIVLRKFGDQLPRLELERPVGVGLLYLALLATLHFMAAPTEDRLFETASAGQGGGAIGAAILWVLFRGFGVWGGGVMLIAWWIIAIVFTAGLSVPEIVTLVMGWVSQAQGRLPAWQLPLPHPDDEPDDEPEPPATVARLQPNPKTPRAAPPETILDRRQSVGIPTSLSAPASPYDQPLVIGGEQPWELPKGEDILDPGTETGADDDMDRERVQVIENTLASFGAPVKVVEVNRGPTITQYGVEPEFVELRSGKKTKVKVGKIAALADDLALALSAQSIRIEAPVPGKGFVGIEVPNVETSVVALRDVMESENFTRLKGTLRLGLGQDVSGTAISTNLTKLPHLLIAGTTGSGKSVCVNAIIACLLLQNTPDDLKLMMVDPKRVELTSYNGIPHLLTPVVVELERVVASLQWVTREMDERYRKFAKAGARNLEDYNGRMEASGEKKIPYLVVIIDELADLMMLAPDETERTIARLAQLARATGIHLIIATQRPSVDVVTGLIKANFPARIAFAVASGVDSRVILDQPGAERLLGRGDMLFQSPDAPSPLRMQGVYVSDHELQRLVRYWKGARGFEMPTVTADAAPMEPSSLLAMGQGASASGGAPLRQSPLPQLAPLIAEPFEARPEGEDELLDEAIKAVREMKKASISLLQRRLRIGYTRAARLIDVLEEKGIIGPAESGAKPREVINFGEQIIDPSEPPPDDEQRQWTEE
jgi:DNA segregation ATPase FtsK/SpoIIIE, S-DNA-T family